MSYPIGRRGLLAAVAAGALGGVCGVARPAGAASPPVALTAGRRTLDVNGCAASVFGILQPDGRQGLVTSVTAPFRVDLRNACGEATLIHWHGLTPPYQQDGVPGISAPAIPPGGSASYDFPLAFPGTFWMHSHQGLQEQQLMAAPLIIHDADARRDEQEVVLMLHDFSFRSPQEIFAGLRHAGSSPAGKAMDDATAKAGNAMAGHDMGGTDMQGDDMKGMAMPSMSHGGMADMDMKDMDMKGMAPHRNGDAGAAGMAMDLNDVEYDAFLANDRTLADPEVVRVEPGGRVRLRIINGAAASNFSIMLGGGVTASLIAVDGHPVEPVRGSMFPVAIAQRLDLRIELPRGPSATPVLAVLEGERARTGIILATAGAMVKKLGGSAAKEAAPLTFAVERTLRAASPLAPRRPDRVLNVDLTGSMQDYVWGLNGRVFGEDAPLMVARGERVELVMTNRTMMSHPMHLHGHVFQVVAANGARFAGAVRDTVLMPPMTSVTVAFDADNPGKWAFHCHNLYHMAAGMMTTVQYTQA